jgi:uncharacterized phiE125 gp8 family phage protein
MSIRVITAPTTEPVTLAEARLWCRVDDDNTAEDAMLLLLIAAMRSYAENITGRVFAGRELELRLPCFPQRVIELPYPPLRAVSRIQYLDTGGVWQELSGSPSTFQVDEYHEPGRVWPLWSECWPATRAELDAVRIAFTCGYAGPSQVPAALRVWMQARIATLYENREQLVVGSTVNALPHNFADGLLDELIVGSRLF